MSRAGASTLVLKVRAPLARSDLTGLYARACASLSEREVEVVLCHVAGVAADAVAVEALARLRLAARRRGAEVRLCGAPLAMREIVGFMGLAEVLPGEAA